MKIARAPQIRWNIPTCSGRRMGRTLVKMHGKDGGLVRAAFQEGLHTMTVSEGQ